MNFDPNDPRWSALILDPDSLSADERGELNELAASNEAAGRLIGELRAAAGEMEVELRKELVTPSQWRDMEAAVKNELASKAVETPVKIVAGQGSRRRWFAAIAALLLVGVTISVIYGTRANVYRAMANRAVLAQNASAIKQVQSTRPHPKHARGEVLTPFGDKLQSLEGEESKNRELSSLTENGKTNEAIDESGAATTRLATASTSPRERKPTPHPGAPARADDYAEPAYEYSERTVDKLHELPKLAAGGQPAATPSPQFYAAPLAAAVVESNPGLRQYNGQTPHDTRSSVKVDGETRFALGIPREESREGSSRGVDRWHAEAPYGNTEVYPSLVENAFIKAVGQDALSTFSIDVDTASYANVRRFLTQNMLPPAGAVRVEELVNYFRYDYAPPTGEHPFAVHVETAACPWEPKHRLARIALKGKVIDEDKRPASNLVFLLDVSGSMNEPNKLPLVKQSLRMLVERLTENDRVAIAVYAGASGLALDSTTGDKKDLILGAIDSLTPGGSTNGEAGIKLAYQQAVKGFIKGGTNRVILCTDGDFNVGVSDDTELVNIITEQAKSGVFLSVLGFGMGNYKDAKMMQLSDKGNGNYAYIDTAREGRKVLVEQMSGTLITIAKDVKIQIEFNPQKVAAYRLIGYEKRMLKNEDFKDDAKDAGEIGAGHTVTALYELVPADGAVPSKVDPLIFQPTKGEPAVEQPVGPKDDRTLVVKLRYKKPDGDTSTEFRTDVKDEGKAFSAATKDFQFASAVASFGMILRNSEFKGGGNLAAVAEIAAATKGADEGGYRQEFVDLVNAARRIQPGK